jgi:cell division topological specificity factor
VFEFIQRFFGKPSSSATAKERLRLVLLSDHLSLAPDVVEALKHDLLEVISRYVDVDEQNCDVTFEQREKEVAMLANIPILGMRTRPTPPPAPPPPPPTSEPDPAPALDLDGATASVAEETGVEPAPVVAVERLAPKRAAQNGEPRPPRKKRRRQASTNATAGA